MGRIELPIYEKKDKQKPKSGVWKNAFLYSLILFTIVFGYKLYCKQLTVSIAEDTSYTSLCPLSEKIVPPSSKEFSDLAYFRSNEYKNHSLNVWAGAVRIPTQTFDDEGDADEDPRFKIFFVLEQYLLKAFPHIKEGANLTHINTHALVFTIKGSDPSLKPVLLIAHQDVVPVPPETISRWKYPPFSGHFDGKYLWGRGAADDKDHFIAVMEATDKLLSEGFKPKRTLILGIGFDEEVNGERGSKRISEYLMQKYGPNSLFFMTDEGGMGVQDIYGARLALPSTGEKGYLDVTIDLMTSGGHGSIPPRHTAIGIMSDLVTLLESTPYEMRLTDKNPFFVQLQCMADKGYLMDPTLKTSIKRMTFDSKAKEFVLKVLDKDIMTRYLASTSQAINIIDGGMKINALPEKVTLKINHRIGYDSSIKEVKKTVLEKVKLIASKYSLGVDGFDDMDSTEFRDIPSGKFVLSSDVSLIQAPKSPASGDAWNLFSGSIKHVYEDFAIYPDSDPSTNKEVIVAPSVMTANTDSKYYWGLTKNIYRFSPMRGTSAKNLHAINERVELDSHVEGVAFFYTLLRNVYQYDLNNILQN